MGTTRYLLLFAFLPFPVLALERTGAEVFIPSATPGVRVNGYAFYTRPAGVDMISIHGEQTESDKSNVAYRRDSQDNGETWSDPTSIRTNWETEKGTRRRGAHPGFVDPDRKVLVTFYNEGILPTDDPLEGMKHWTLRYSLSRDGGESIYHEGPVVHRGENFGPEHPFPGVWTGKNATMLGDHTCYPIKIGTGEILLPIQITPIGPDGEYDNPGGGYTYHDSAVLIGTWNSEGTLDWEISERVVADPNRSTRGMLEPTLAQFPDGRILMAMRGSNHTKPELPSYRWFSVSADRGRTWSEPEPWTFKDGKPFFSPSSCSQLLAHSSGKFYWIGNISPTNPDGNLPRYPLLVGEVDAQSMKLIESTLCIIDDRREGDAERTMISNFFAHEDRETGEVVVYAAPTFRKPPKPDQEGLDWTSDLYRYRIAISN